MKVLFCTDGSATSFNSIINFDKWVKDYDLDILSVADWGYLPDSIAIEGSEFAIKCANSVENILMHTQKKLENIGINVNKQIKLCGTAMESILELCNEEVYDYIVLGSGGKKGVQKWFGSVSNEVVSMSECSVFVSKNTNVAEKILFTVDGSELNDLTIDKVIDTFALEDKQIELLTVFELPDYLFIDGENDKAWINEVKRAMVISAQNLLDRIEQKFNKNNLEVASKTYVEGSPANEIINYSKNNGIDLIVTGIRERRFKSRFVLGSVSRQVLEEVNSDVLVVRL